MVEQNRKQYATFLQYRYPNKMDLERSPEGHQIGTVSHYLLVKMETGAFETCHAEVSNV